MAVYTIRKEKSVILLNSTTVKIQYGILEDNKNIRGQEDKNLMLI